MKLRTLDKAARLLEGELGENIGSGGFKNAIHRISVVIDDLRQQMVLASLKGLREHEAAVTVQKHQFLKNIGVDTHDIMLAVENERGCIQLLMTDQTKGGEKIAVSFNHVHQYESLLQHQVSISPEADHRIHKKLTEQANSAASEGVMLYHDSPLYIIGKNASGDFELEEVIVAADLDKVSDMHGFTGEWHKTKRDSRSLRWLRTGLRFFGLDRRARYNQEKMDMSYLSFLLSYDKDRSNSSARSVKLQRLESRDYYEQLQHMMAERH